MKIPVKPHSQVGIITSAVDEDYLLMNLKSFDPYGVIIGGTTTLWDLIIYLSQTAGVDIKDEKEILASEIAAAKIYPAILMSYLQALRAQKNIADKCPIFVSNVSTSDGIFTEDEWWFEMTMGSNGKYPSVQGIEDFITRINPVWKTVNEYPLLNFPAGYYLQWVPNKTTAEMRALRVLMGTYAEAYRTFCMKSKIKLKVLDPEAFCGREVKEFKQFDYGNKDYIFWAGSGGYVSIRNGANADYNMITSRTQSTGEAFDVTTANWLSARDKYYVIPEDGEPSDLCAAIQMLFPHNAQNLLGAVVPNDGGGINDDTLEAADVMGAQLSRHDPATTKDTTAVAMDRALLCKLFPALPLMFADQDFAQAAFLKETEEAGETTKVDWKYMAGGNRTLGFDTNIWDNSNALLVQTFLQEMFGKSGKQVTQPKPRYTRVKKKAVKTIGDAL